MRINKSDLDLYYMVANGFNAIIGIREVRNADKSIIHLPRHHVVRGLHISAELRHNAAYLAR